MIIVADVLEGSARADFPGREDRTSDGTTFVKPHSRSALRLTLIYVLFGSLWIGLSDYTILLFSDDPATLTRLQNFKGWFYVLVTGGLVWFLANVALGRQASLVSRLQASESRFRSIFNNVNDGILIHDLVEDKIVDTNPRMRRLFGCSRSQVTNLGIKELSADDPAENLEVARHHIAKARDGEPSRFEWKVRRPGGGSFWAEVTIRTAEIDGKAYAIMVIRDISEQKASLERLRLAAAVFDSTRDGIVITDESPVIISANPAYCRSTGYPLNELEGQDPAFIRANGNQEDSTPQMWRILKELGYWEGDIKVRIRTGEVRDQRLKVTAVSGNGNGPTHYVGVYSDITDLRQVQKKLEDLAYYDPLTRLPNRLLFHSRIESAIERARTSGQKLAVVYLDLDNFKNVNDSFGHPLGDDLLIAVTRRLQSHVNDRGLLAHLGGDEFALLVENLEDPDELTRFSESLLERLESPFDLGNSNTVYMSASAGISSYPQHARSPVEMIQYAHAAMYLAKKLGRHQVCWFTPGLVHKASERLQLEAKLHKGLENQEFVLYYQPIRAGKRGEKTIGYEALCRWQPPGEPMVSPEKFIPVAEDSGLIIPLGEWVIKRACEQLREWHDQGHTDRSISVNLSARQFLTRDICSMLRGVLEKTGASPGHLHLELTESILMEQGHEVLSTLEELKKTGVSLVLDDFGTGYSCLAYLRHMPLDLIKIDRQFINDMVDHAAARELVMAIISMAKCLHLEVLAEGIENEEQLELLIGMGCDQYQGFHFGKPVPASQIRFP